MSQRVSNGAIYETGHDYGNGTHSVNRTGRVFYLCDCCETRRQFATRDAADAHEDGNTPAPHMPHGEYGTHNEYV